MKNPRPAGVFVFGSNLRGAHGKGAALFAYRYHGAVYGQASGLQGNSYAIPTKDHKLKTLGLPHIKASVHEFYAFARAHPELTFTVTPIGCGLAGYKPAQIAPLFYQPPDNVSLPDEFVRVLLRRRPAPVPALTSTLLSVAADAAQARRVFDQARVMLCDHDWLEIAQIYRAEIDADDPKRHTTFLLLGCVWCRSVDAFPADNARLATASYISRLRAQLAAGGWILPVDIEWGPRQ